MKQARHETVSLSMIVRNEAHQLGECLAPVAHLFNDIVVADTGSSDGTRQVAERFGARVVDFPWCDDFSAARNASLAEARGDWIFWLDADDRVSSAGAAKLEALFAGLTPRPQAFLMQTLLELHPEGRDRQRLASHVRLFRHHPQLGWQRRVHEHLQPWPAALGYEIVFTDIQIQHLGYQDSLLSERKLRRNLRLLHMDFAVAPDDPAVLVDLGYAHAQLGKYPAARRYLHSVLSDPRPLPFLRRRAFATLGEMETTEGNFAAAAALLALALVENPGDEYLLYMYSEALYNLGRHDEAKAALVEILQQMPTHERFFVGGPSDIRQRLARLALGEVLRVDRALCESESILLGVVDDFPADPTAWYFLGRVYIDGREWNKLARVLARLAECEGGAIFRRLLTASGELAHGDYRASEQTLNELIGMAPSMVLPRVLRAECLFRRSALPAEQRQACLDVLRLQPQNARAHEILGQLATTQAVATPVPALSLCTSVILSPSVPGGVVSV